MELHLGDEQTRLLQRIVDAQIGDLGAEIAHTDNPAFRRELGARGVLLRQIVDRLGGRIAFTRA